MHVYFIFIFTPAKCYLLLYRQRNIQNETYLIKDIRSIIKRIRKSRVFKNLWVWRHKVRIIHRNDEYIRYIIQCISRDGEEGVRNDHIIKRFNDKINLNVHKYVLEVLRGVVSWYYIRQGKWKWDIREISE